MSPAKLLLHLALLAAPASALWRARKPMPFQLSDQTATYVPSEGLVVIAGGCADHQVSCDWWEGCSYCPAISAKTLRYDVAQDSWARGEDGPRTRYRHAAALDASTATIYLVGGRDVDDFLVSPIDAYDVAKDAWSTLEAAVPRSDLGALFLAGGRLLVAGGYDKDYAAYASTLFVDVATNAVSEGPALRAARGDFGLVAAGGVAYAIAGWSDQEPSAWCNPFKSVETLALDDPNAKWEAGPQLLVARGDKSAAASEDAVYVVGGEHNSQCSTGSVPVDDVERLAVGDTEWAAIADIPEERFRAAAAVVDGTLYVFGGQEETSSDCEGFDFCFQINDHTWALDVSGDGPGDSKKKQSTAASGGLVAAIVVAVLVPVFILLLLYCCCCKRSPAAAEARVAKELAKEPVAVTEEPEEPVGVALVKNKLSAAV